MYVYEWEHRPAVDTGSLTLLMRTRTAVVVLLY